MQGEYTGQEAFGSISQRLGQRRTGDVRDPQATIDGAVLDMASPASPLPASVDLSGKMPPVGNQGDQGSCVGWATAYAAQTFAEKLEWNWSVDLTRYQYSPSWIYNQINGGVDDGTTISRALDLIVEKGADTLAFFPYADANFTNQPNAASLTRAARFKAASWNTVSGTVNIKQILAGGRPVIARFAVLPDFDNLNTTTNTVYDTDQGTNLPSCTVAPCSRGGHAIALTGYDDDKQAFRLRNSWGPSFGFNGDSWIAYSFISNANLGFAAYVLNDKKDAVPATSPNLYAIQGAALLRTDKEFGDWSPPLGTGSWTGATSGAALNGSLYIIQSGQLLKTSSSGSWQRLGVGDWSGATEMTTLNGKLYVIQSGQLLLVSTTDGTWTRVGTASWTSSVAMAGVNGKLFIIRSGKLYRVDPSTGVPTQLGTGTGWTGLAELSGLNGALYAVQSDQLLLVNQTDGSWSRLGTGLYQNVSALTSISGKLYMVHDGNLVMADTAGAWQVLGPRAAWAGTKVLMALN